MRGTLAQLVEQRTFNPFVVGSTPARPTTRTRDPGPLRKRQRAFHRIGFVFHAPYLIPTFKRLVNIRD